MMLWDYLKARRWTAALLALWMAIGGAVFALYGMPSEPLMYALALCALAALAFAARDYLSYRARRRRLMALESMPEPDALALADLPEPASGAEADYQRLLRGLLDRGAAQTAQGERARAELAEYYTLWAHQVKTPIAAMGLMLQGDDGELAQAMKPELLRVERYVDMALNYARLGGDDSDLVIRPCDVGALVRQAVRKLAPLFIRKRLSVDVEEMDVRALTDEKWLAFALEQVLDNAVKYTRQGGVTIRAEAGPVLVIRDTGIGIAPQDLPRIFERSFTGLNGRADRRATGLGLYLARRALTRLGHGIRVESETGVGTAVYIDLSAAPTDVRD